jgi:hypothetical protein
VTSVARQRRCKHSFEIIERLCFLRGMFKVVINNCSVEAVQTPTLMWHRVEKGVIRKHQLKNSNSSLFIKGGTTKDEKTKVLTLNKYMAMGPSGARCQEWPCWLVAGSKLLPALLCSAVQRSSSREESNFETPACPDVSLGAEEFNWIDSCRMTRKELGCSKKTSCVIWS